MTGAFKDHFSKQSDGYVTYRPTYPAALFEYLASLTPHRDLAWDCATGNGQAALALTDFFSTVVASDASQAQIDAALPHAQIKYSVVAAEHSGLAGNCVDLVTVAQAFHWFDAAAFMTEACRVLRPQGALAIWCYELCSVTDECDAIIARLYTEIVGSYWPAERVTIEQGYSNIQMPGEAVPVPEFEMAQSWRASDMLGYLRTWSACQRYASEKGSDPVALIAAELLAAWGDSRRKVVWPLAVRVSRPNI